MKNTNRVPFKLNKPHVAVICSVLFGFGSFPVLAQQTELDGSTAAASIEKIEIQGKAVSLIGEAISASEGIIGQQEILNRPMLRSGEILELVPGMVVTQHSGTGKANQYFLRGFNLDHGTDFATSIDNMPINMRTHGHGQGYTDLNFIIPETINTITFKKGAYYGQVGDFSGAGGADFNTVNQRQTTQLATTLGEDNFQRYLLAGGLAMDNNHLNYAIEFNRYDGPWTDIEEDLNKTNVFLSYNTKLNNGDLKLTFMGYDNSWNSADQIPQRAVTAGIIDELGSIDTSLGGNSSRYSINAAWKSQNLQASAYFIDYDLNLWSNFTYFLDNPTTGDQFEQVDKRQIYGGHISYTTFATWQGKPISNEFGAQARIDDIDEVGLFQTQQRQRLGAIRNDAVTESSLGFYWQNNIIWNDFIKTIVSARYDFFDFDVRSNIDTNINDVDLSVNKGTEDAGNVALKANVIYTFSESWEGYLSAGQGFHSNDARGTIVQVDPNSGESIAPVDPIVDSIGYELGLRGNLSERLNVSMSIWQLKLDSELLFVGDAGNTEPSDASTRTGIELTGYYSIANAFSFDFEYAYTQAEFDELPKNANQIPGALEHVVQTGLSYQPQHGWFAAARLRYFSDRPLVEDGSITSDDSKIMNLNVGYKFAQLTLKLDVLNALDSKDHDIDYYYASRFANEPLDSATEDLHYHVLEPRTVRLSAVYRF
ncbi:TonB-dependent receptor [Paraglaciecola arctica]|uniref:TonB-dependent receptor n=1 Tax=Paraglaciecola arctica TaxID=1128911 RepID=UPI001C07B35F|nr:TonB-dependent receptor [Paraglaciecola arctica]MBU3006165.1 TonB-dependent receptor plug domain-containing protein [Paraglaciecola arctica]